jgi:hypothetical protein
MALFWAADLAEADTPKTVKWEYCELFVMARPALKDMMVHLRLPSEEIEVHSFKELGEKLGQKDLKNATGAINALGAKGWELVSVTEHVAEGDLRVQVRTYALKRAKESP